MQILSALLARRLEGARRIAVLGIGSELRGDDAAGILVCRKLEKLYSNSRQRKVKVFIGETAPENLTGEIKRFCPTHLIIVDAIDVRKRPGSVVFLKPEESKGVSFCTHQLPIKILTDYLAQSLKCGMIIIGIQAGQMGFGSLPCAAVSKSAMQVADLINSCAGRTGVSKG